MLSCFKAMTTAKARLVAIIIRVTHRLRACALPFDRHIRIACHDTALPASSHAASNDSMQPRPASVICQRVRLPCLSGMDTVNAVASPFSASVRSAA